MYRIHSKMRPQPLNPKRVLPVLLPVRASNSTASSADHHFDPLPIGRLRVIHLLVPFITLAVATAYTVHVFRHAVSDPDDLVAALDWVTPVIAHKFVCLRILLTCLLSGVQVHRSVIGTTTNPMRKHR